MYIVCKPTDEHSKDSTGLDNFGHSKLSTKNTIPEATRDSEPVLVIGEMVLKMILFEFAIVRR